MADAMKLLPCPFCGGTDLEATFHYFNSAIACQSCEATLPLPTKSPETQAAAWNRRASPPAREEAPAEGAGELAQVCRRMAGDYQSSRTHHPDHVLMERADFEAMVAALASPPSERERELAVLLDNLVIAQSLSRELRTAATDQARSYLYSYRHPTAQPAGEGK